MGGGRNQQWVVGDQEAGYPIQVRWIPIKRPMMVGHDASPANPALRDDWKQREATRKDSYATKWQRERSRRQTGLGPICNDRLPNDDALHAHPVTPKSQGGEDKLANLKWVPLSCPQQIHGARK